MIITASSLPCTISWLPAHSPGGNMCNCDNIHQMSALFDVWEMCRCRPILVCKQCPHLHMVRNNTFKNIH